MKRLREVPAAAVSSDPVSSLLCAVSPTGALPAADDNGWFCRLAVDEHCVGIAACLQSGQRLPPAWSMGAVLPGNSDWRTDPASCSDADGQTAEVSRSILKTHSTIAITIEAV